MKSEELFIQMTDNLAFTYKKWHSPTMIPKQNSEAKQINPLFRFVTKEAVAKVLKVKPEQIRDIRCWA